MRTNLTAYPAWVRDPPDSMLAFPSRGFYRRYSILARKADTGSRREEQKSTTEYQAQTSGSPYQNASISAGTILQRTVYLAH
jgi:hypothetical protein